MELRQLRYFLAVADELHFGRAAERLGMAQPSLSRQIRDLEIMLKAELFARTSRRVELTTAGLLFLNEARATLRQADHAASVAERAQRGILGEIDIGLFPSAPFAPSIAASLREFRQAFPQVHLTLRERASHTAMAEVAKGRLDIAFVRSDGNPALPVGARAIEMFTEEMLAVFHEGHRLASETGPVPIEELANEPLVHFPPRYGSPLQEQVFRICREAGFEPRIEQEANQNGTIVGLVAAGIGVSILTPTICKIQLPGLRMRPIIARGRITFTAFMVYRGNDPLVRAMVDIARTHMEGTELRRAGR